MRSVRFRIFCCRAITFFTALPATPVAVGVVEVTTATVRLIWASGDSGPVDPTVTYTIVYRELDGGSATENEMTDIAGTEYRITGLSAFTTYLFQVVAVSDVGRGLRSRPIKVSTDQLG